MDIFTILLTVFIGVISLFLWHTMTFFKNTGIPHEKPWPIFGNMLPVLLRQKHFFKQVVDNYEKWQDVKYFGFYDFITPVIVIRDVELIKSIALKNFDNFMDHRTFVSEETDPLFGKSLFGLKGNKWREVRSLLSPAFTSSKMRQMSELMASCAKDFSDFIVKKAKQGNQDFEMKDAFTKFTSDVIASCAFGISVNTMKDPENDFYVLGKGATNFAGWKTIKMLFNRFCPTLAKFLNVRVIDPKVTTFFMDIVKSTIETREKEGIVRPDMIQLMMESREKNNVIQLDLLDMTAQAFVFFFGGFDGTSSLMSFAALALSLNPQIQDRLLEEIDEVMKRTNGKPNYDNINSMPYLEAILYETLRYYPIGGFSDRLCTESFELPPAAPGMKPFTVKPGMNVWFPSQGIHEDPLYYENPKTFDPDRFLDQKVTVNSPTYLVFGIGPRSCIGNRFALLENKLILFNLLTKCKFAKSKKLKEPIDFVKSSFLLLVDGGFWIKIVPRDGFEVYNISNDES